MKNTLLVLTLAILNLTACSSLESLKAGNERRVFETQNKWVRRTTSFDNMGFRKINRMKPLLYKQWVIQANGLDGISAYDQQSGQEQWRLDIQHGVEASAAIINDRIFFGANDGQFYSVFAETGKVLWTFPIRIEGLSEPLIADGNVYFVTGNNTLYALDASSGKQLWLYSRQDTAALSIRGGSKPFLKNGTLYAGFSDGSIVALLASNGAVKWEKQLNKNKKFRDLDSDPVVEGDFLYILGYDDHIYCLRAATGDIAWRSEQGGYGSILIYGDRLYYAGTSGAMLALNKETGQKIWSYSLQKGIPTSPILHKGLLIFGESQGSLVVLDSGSGRWIAAFDPGRGILSPPTVNKDSDFVYFISNEANLYAIKVGWNYTPAFPYLR